MKSKRWIYDAFDGSGDEMTIEAPEYFHPPEKVESGEDEFELRDENDRDEEQGVDLRGMVMRDRDCLGSDTEPDREALADLLLNAPIRDPQDIWHDYADAVIAAGWRPPDEALDGDD